MWAGVLCVGPCTYVADPPESDLPRFSNYILFIVRHKSHVQMHLAPRDNEHGNRLVIYNVGGRVLTRVGATELWPCVSALLCGDGPELTQLEQITRPKFFGVLPWCCMINTVAICIE
jgi:hypothetical protein